MQSAVVNNNGGSGLRSMESSHKSIVMLRCKVVIVGTPRAPRSLKSNRRSPFSALMFLQTIGAELSVKQVPIPDSNYIVELFIYDCAGQSIFNQLDMNSKYYEGAAAVVLVYSVASRESLQSTSKWFASECPSIHTHSHTLDNFLSNNLTLLCTAVKAALPSNSNPISIIVGNKTDLRDGTLDSRAEVATYEASSFAANMALNHFDVSAANNTGVEEPFKYIAEEFVRRYQQEVDSKYAMRPI
eukprot:scaffold2066_cov229-Ochromonas_danica.AAC.19